MNDKIVKALEQARRDRGLKDPTPPIARAPRVIGAPRLIDAPRAIGPVTGPPRATFAPPTQILSDTLKTLKTTAEGIDGHLVSLLDPISFGAEQYRALRYVVEQAHRIEQLSIVAVTAPPVGDGKTTTAINLAGALAQASDARVVLIDADLRRPALHRYLGLGEARR